jgi:hypothetical protein
METNPNTLISFPNIKEQKEKQQSTGKLQSEAQQPFWHTHKQN